MILNSLNMFSNILSSNFIDYPLPIIINYFLGLGFLAVLSGILYNSISIILTFFNGFVVTLVHGGVGSGKTYSIKSLCKEFLFNYKHNSVLVVALPTKQHCKLFWLDIVKELSYKYSRFIINVNSRTFSKPYDEETLMARVFICNFWHLGYNGDSPKYSSLMEYIKVGRGFGSKTLLVDEYHSFLSSLS